MIVSMKRIFVVAQSKDAKTTLVSLRDLGAVHVEHERLPEGVSLDHVRGALSLLDQAIQTVRNYSGSHKIAQRPVADWRSTAEEILKVEDDLEEAIVQDRERQAVIDQFAPWGDFDPRKVKQLAQSGVYVRFYEIPSKEMAKIPAEAVTEMIGRKGEVLYVMVVSRKELTLPFVSLILPGEGLSEARQKKEAGLKRIAELKTRLQQYVGVLEGLLKARQRLSEEFRFEEALSGMGQKEDLVFVKGFCPVDAVEKISDAAKKNKWAVLLADPAEGEQPPTLLRNPAWVGLINPVFNFMGILPGYREMDVSVPFLFFFSLFFGILVGDGGYGILFLLLTIFAQRKAGAKVTDKTPFFLFYVLSFSAILWGTLTGTFFGQTLFTFIKPVAPWLNKMENMQALCFVIGLTHLTLARIWRIVILWPSPKIMAELGWICFLLGSYFLTRMILLDAPLPALAYYALIAGAVLVVLFNSPGKNIFMTILNGIMSLPGATNMFMDLMSYIRLFAVGAASVTLADAFNQMVLGIGFNNVLAGLGAAVILALGHLLNVVLSLMGVFVHGIRLNVLEFSNHIGLEWQGVKYEPLCRQEKIHST